MTKSKQEKWEFLKKHSPLKVCISGDIGSGKSTIRNFLHHRLELPIYSTGDFQRQLAKSKSMSTLKLNQYAETHPEIDFEIDRYAKKIGKEEDRLIIDSRMAWHFISDSFKIFLTLPTPTAAVRIMNDTNRHQEQYSNLEEAIKNIEARKQSEQRRYRQLYQVSLHDYNHYDLVVDTSENDTETISYEILNSLNAWVHRIPFKHKLFFKRDDSSQ